MIRALPVSIATTVLISPIVWMAMDREPPYSYSQVDIEPETVESGGEIKITFHVHQYRLGCGPGSVYRQFKEADGKLHNYAPIHRKEAPRIVDGRFIRTATVPVVQRSGQITYRGVACYDCNLLQRYLNWPICIPTGDVTFNIVAPNPATDFDLQGQSRPVDPPQR